MKILVQLEKMENNQWEKMEPRGCLGAEKKCFEANRACEWGPKKAALLLNALFDCAYRFLALFSLKTLPHSLTKSLSTGLSINSEEI